MIAGRFSTLANTRRSVPGKSRPDTIAVLDLADVGRAIQRACAGQSSPAPSRPLERAVLNLITLRDFILKRSGPASFLCLAPEGAAQTGLADEQSASRAGWRWVTPGPRLWDDDVCPAVGYSCALLECLRFEHGSAVPPIVLISHDPAWLGPVQRYLDAGGSVIGIGLVEMFDNHLIELTDHGGLELLDLEFDAGAASLPGRCMFSAPGAAVVRS